MRRPLSTYSFSRITTFEQCPRRFRYRYIDGVREAFQGIEAFMGRQVHATIEWMFEQREGGHLPSAAEAIEHYCRVWDDALSSGEEEVRVVKQDRSADLYRRSGAAMLEQFHRRRFLPDRLETIANEHHFRVRVGGRHDFQGFIDRLARGDDGIVRVIDYKTGSRTPRTFSGKEADQLRAYALALFLDTEERQLELVLDFLRSGKVLRQRIDRADAQEVERELAERIDAVEESTVFPPKPGNLCAWCGYNDICDAWQPRVGRAGVA